MERSENILLTERSENGILDTYAARIGVYVVIGLSLLVPERVNHIYLHL
jgi:hypothetical protein